MSRFRLLAPMVGTSLLVGACGGTDVEPPTPAAVVAGTSQSVSARVGDSVAVVVRVVGTDGRGLPGQTVAFAPSAGTVTAPTALTDGGGEGRTTWIVGSATGTQTLTATAGSLPPLTISATVGAGRPERLEVAAGDAQSAVAGTAVAVRPAVRVRDVGGNGVPGVRVAFVVESGGGRLSGDTATTDATGLATAGSWQLGATIGTNLLRAQVVGASLSAQLSATGLAGAPAVVDALFSFPDSAVVGSTVGQPSVPSVRVRDANGNPVAGVPVAFLVTAGHGTVVPLSAVGGADPVTDAQGRASVASFTLDTVAGPNTVTAVVGEKRLAFTVVGRADVFARLQLAGGDEQHAAPHSTLALGLSVRAVDRYGNGVAAVPIDFVPLQKEVTVDHPRQVTDPDGIATSGRVDIGATSGWKIVAAMRSSASQQQVWFNIRVAPGPPAAIGWDWLTVYYGLPSVQSGYRSRPFDVSVRDAYGTPIPNATISFAVSPAAAGVVSTPSRVPGTAVTSLTTGATGVVTVVLDSYDFVGVAKITATAPGVPANEFPIVVTP
ncbi:Ig-like domain-containing protein [Gemmatirosa kalamazoonensis]|nr:Ig-like domain-containing protein [Gemmatirosa kalamazoonensis]